jgi:malonyl-CoA O-methyltransferase
MAAKAIDASALARVQRRLARAPTAPWLHAEVARRMAERLPVIRRQPDTVIDWWAHAGASHTLLAQAYPNAHLLRVEAEATVPASERDGARWWSARRWRRDVPPIAEAALPAGAGQLLWANMMLHAVPDPEVLMQSWRRALSVDGFLMFSTLGPGTLVALRALYRDAGWGAPHAAFTDMHDLGDMLVAAGFADPVMDQESVTLTWATPEALLGELRTLGGNADPARFKGLRTPRWRSRLVDALRVRAGADGRIALDFELVYGHAFKPPPRAKMVGETHVPLDDLRAMARGGRRPSG